MKIVSIDRLEDVEELQVYTDFKENQLMHINEPDLGVFIAESPKVITRALRAGYRPISILKEVGVNDSETMEVLEKLKNEELIVYEAPTKEIANLTGYKLLRGMVCAMKRKVLPSLEDICKGKSRIVVLEDVVNPSNVGAIIRSAAAMKAQGVVLTAACSDPLYRRAARVSMGTVFQVPWTVLGRNQWPDAMDKLREMGYKTASMALTNDSVSIDDDRLMREEKLAIIMGTEGEGLKEETISKSDYVVKIPMAEGVDSLNVAAASAVAFWQLCNYKKS